MLPSNKDSKEAFLESTKAAREARKATRDREKSALKIQTWVRGWLVRVRTAKEIWIMLDESFPTTYDAAPPHQKSALELYGVAKLFMIFGRPNKDAERFERICKVLVSTLDSESPKFSYVGMGLNKDHAVVWISHMKQLLATCLNYLMEKHDVLPKKLSTWLSFLIAFTSIKTWRILYCNKSMEKLQSGMTNLCGNFLGHLVNHGLFNGVRSILLNGISGSRGILMKKPHLTAAITLATRPVIGAGYSEKLVSLYLLNIMSVPGIIEHLSIICPETLKSFFHSNQNVILVKCFKLLCQEQQMKIHFNALEGSYALCLTANLIHLVSLNSENFDNSNIDFVELVNVFIRLLELCGHYVTAKQSSTAHWHPVLGWFSCRMDTYIQESLPTVRRQLSKLWSPSCLNIFARPFEDLVEQLPEHLQTNFTPNIPRLTGEDYSETSTPSLTGATAKQFFLKAVDRTKATLTSGASARSRLTTTSGKPIGAIRLGSQECSKVAFVCAMYQTALQTLSQLRLEILSGLCYQNLLLKPMWSILDNLGDFCGLKQFMDLLAVSPKASSSEFQMLTLFCDCLSYLLTILDDVEMYEKQTPFTLKHYAILSKSLNLMLYRAVMSSLITDPKSMLFVSMHSLLMILYRRDNRRSYTDPDHWLIKECRPMNLIAELDKGKKPAFILIKKLPHVIPHSDRVVLFRRRISSEKLSLGLVDADLSPHRSTLVTIHRSRIVEDGYRQLSTLSSSALKGTIRVKFVNVQGLDEAGIDQDGVFKEFLEETIKKVFDPGLNLFCATSDERLYPSPLSYMTDNHLHLFEFVGKMIGKAIFEGIVVDVPFAPFFVSQILGKDHNTAYYSYMDELPSFDSELYKNLTYIKHYEGDVADLDLTFSFDQDVMGQIVTYELVPGGKAITVTNDNKISYMHLVAQFRMHTQIKEQIYAFTRGFRSLINPEYLTLFSPPEVMRLISGDNKPLDLKDLRKHTHYYGGFHDAHRVINWLWDILEKDFDGRERAAFLKFVTSCSKPPLLGFEHLEPPFAIRCVEVGDDEDNGDTVGSVVRGFLALRRKDPVNRLPTASTCFNLLKLPNYQKKSTLREKLRYAISNNTGFEIA